MKVTAHDLGKCGLVNLFYAGTIKFNTTGASAGVVIFEAPHDMVITGAVAEVTTAFDAGTTNVLTVGANSDVNDILGSSDVTEGTKGAYCKNTFVKLEKGDKVKAKFTETGTDATAGAADIYLYAVGVPAS
ncbi:MAG: hypothetical protein IKD59_04775 [Lachnospiraceae bacterium]|nr:hypothetical protein [Lachnospiraceae bacterium]